MSLRERFALFWSPRFAGVLVTAVVFVLTAGLLADWLSLGRTHAVSLGFGAGVVAAEVAEWFIAIEQEVAADG